MSQDNSTIHYKHQPLLNQKESTSVQLLMFCMTGSKFGEVAVSNTQDIISATFAMHTHSTHSLINKQPRNILFPATLCGRRCQKDTSTVTGRSKVMSKKLHKQSKCNVFLSGLNWSMSYMPTMSHIPVWRSRACVNWLIVGGTLSLCLRIANWRWRRMYFGHRTNRLRSRFGWISCPINEVSDKYDSRFL